MITVPEQNLYASNGTILAFPDNTELLKRTQLTINDIEEKEGQYHTVKSQDRLDLIAYAYYQNFTDFPARYWWLIADVNEIENPLDLTSLVGTEILIPNFLDARLALG